MERIVSLLPSTTEIVCALELGDQLVGRSHECDHPPGVERLPVLTEPRIDAEATSRAIDDQVKARLRDALSIYRVDVGRLRELAPDVILTQDQCEVCAVSAGELEAALGDWLTGRPRLVSLSPTTLGGVFSGIQQAADSLGVQERGRALCASLASELTGLAERAQALPDRPRVACVEWIDPLMTAGNWMPELVTIAGGVNLLSALGRHSPWIDWPALRDADPDVVVVLPCGFDLARTRKEMGPLLSQPGWDALRAVREGRVFLADGHRFFNRPGPRLVESLEILCEILHPEAFAPRHEGTAWQRLATPSSG